MNGTTANTTKMRMVAKEVVGEQARVCEERQSNLSEKLHALAESTQANTKLVSDLAQTVAVIVHTIEPLPTEVDGLKERVNTEVDGLKERVNKLARRPAFWAAVGSAIPVLANALWELARKP